MRLRWNDSLATSMTHHVRVVTHRVAVVIRMDDNAINFSPDDTSRSVVPVVHVEQDLERARRSPWVERVGRFFNGITSSGKEQTHMDDFKEAFELWI